MKRTLLTIAILALVAIPALHHASAAKPVLCGPVVYGHSMAGNAPSLVCGPENEPLFTTGDHYQSTDSPCPWDQREEPYPNYAGHTLPGD